MPDPNPREYDVEVVYNYPDEPGDRTDNERWTVTDFDVDSTSKGWTEDRDHDFIVYRVEATLGEGANYDITIDEVPRDDP